MADTKCSYCESLNGGHTLACSSLDQEWDGDEAARAEARRLLGERRRQVPVDNISGRIFGRGSKPDPETIP